MPIGLGQYCQGTLNRQLIWYAFNRSQKERYVRKISPEWVLPNEDNDKSKNEQGRNRTAHNDPQLGVISHNSIILLRVIESQYVRWIYEVKQWGYTIINDQHHFTVVKYRSVPYRVVSCHVVSCHVES